MDGQGGDPDMDVFASKLSQIVHTDFHAQAMQSPLDLGAFPACIAALTPLCLLLAHTAIIPISELQPPPHVALPTQNMKILGLPCQMLCHVINDPPSACVLDMDACCCNVLRLTCAHSLHGLKSLHQVLRGAIG